MRGEVEGGERRAERGKVGSGGLRVEGEMLRERGRDALSARVEASRTGWSWRPDRRFRTPLPFQELESVIRELRSRIGELELPTGEPKSVIGEPGSVIRELESVMREPTSVIREPRSLIGEPESLIGDPKSVIREPEAVICEPPGRRRGVIGKTRRPFPRPRWSHAPVENRPTRSVYGLSDSLVAILQRLKILTILPGGQSPDPPPLVL